MLREARLTAAATLTLVVLGSSIYLGTLDNPFVFDDVPSIVEATQIESLWPMNGPAGSGQSGRPLVALSLALNYAIGGREVLGYHLFNIAMHVLTALALFGVARRSFLASGEREAARATELGFAIAALWVVHPLHSDALNHVVYRNETMMACFYLTTLYCALRSFQGARAWRWCALAACLAAMACKEVAVSLPLAVLAFDAFFGAKGYAAALRARPAWYAGLASTWVALALFVASGDRGASVGLGHAEILSSTDYFRTQLVAVPTYLRLSFLPWPLIFDYFDGHAVRSWTPVLLPGLLLGTLLLLSLHAFWKRRAAGLLGLSIAAILAPTSSVIPLGGELIAEHRMVLPLAALIAMVVIFTHRILSWRGAGRAKWAPALLSLAVLALAATTWQRNHDYRDLETLWRDTVSKRPDNARAWNHLGLALRDREELVEAEAAFRESIRLEPKNGMAQFNLANLYFGQGKMLDAAEWYGASIEQRKQDPIAHYNFGSALLLSGNTAPGLEQYARALELQPGWELPASRLAWIRAAHPAAALRDGAQALAVAREMIEVSGASPRALDILAAALAELGRFEEARATARQAAQAARSAGQLDFAAEVSARAELYAAGQPYRKP